MVQKIKEGGFLIKGTGGRIMPIFPKKQEKKPALAPSPYAPGLGDLDEPPKPLFDQHKAAMTSDFEKSIHDQLKLPEQFNPSTGSTPHFSLDAESSFHAPSEEKKQGDIPINYDALLEEKQSEIKSETKNRINSWSASDDKPTFHQPTMSPPPEPFIAHFIPLTALRNAETVIYSLKDDLAISNDTLFRVDELNKQQLTVLEKWHLDLDYVDTLLNNVDSILFNGG